jgi:hypothetical protein
MLGGGAGIAYQPSAISAYQRRNGGINGGSNNGNGRQHGVAS